MKIRRLICTLLLSVGAILLSCTLSFASQAAVDSDWGKYVYPERFNNCILIDGVDVSVWQGKEVNWEQVKRHGMDYAFLRIGYTGLDSPFSMNKDSCFETNYEKAKAAGVMVGVYYYSCATTMKEAQKEAQFVLDTLARRDLDLPVVFDFEFAGRVADKFKVLNKATVTSNILAFLNYIDENSDYEPMFYSYRNITDPTWNPKFNINLIDGKYKVWLAQYAGDIGYTRPFQFWQYTSTGEVKGIDGDADCNFWFYDNDAEVTKEGTSNIKDADVKLSKKTYEFTRYQKKPTVSVSYMGTPLTEGIDYKLFYLKNTNAGTAYAMVKGIGAYSNTKLVPYTITPTNIADGAAIAEIKPQKYQGKPVTVSPVVTYKGTALKKGIDYTLSYKNNKAAGTATVIMTGIRNYTGETSATFQIVKLQSKPEVTGKKTITKKLTSPAFPLGLTTTSTGAVTYFSSDPSIATISADGTVTLTGKTGTVTLTMETAATAKHFAASTSVTLRVTKLTDKITNIKKAYTVLTNAQPFVLSPAYKGTGQVSYTSSNPAVATVDENGLITVTGPGKTRITLTTSEDDTYFSTSATVNLTVNRTKAEVIQCIKKSTIKATSKASYGSVKINWKKTGEEDVDYYEIFRSKKKNGFGTKRFAKTAKGSVSTYKNNTYLVKNKTYYYKVRGVKVIDGKKYYTKWSNVTYKKYKYTGSADIKKINGIKATKVKASSSRGKGYIKTKWKKQGNYKVDYYQIYRSTKKNFASGKVTYKTKSGKQLTFKNTTKLKKGKRYYYKIRGVRLVDGKKYYTKWSNVVTRVAK